MKKIAFLTMLLLISCGKNDNAINGYVEGIFVYAAPSTSGVLEELLVERGSWIKAGDKLFTLNTKGLQANVDASRLSLEQAYANLANLSKGQRPEEILIIVKQLDQAKAQLFTAEHEFKRYSQLVKDKIVSQSDMDSRKSDYDAARAKVGEMQANINTAMLGAREDEIISAGLGIEIARQNLIIAEKQYADSNPVTQTDAYVEDTYFRSGEMVAAAIPVVKLLPPENIKARFFVSQAQFPQFQHGTEVFIDCDGCVQPIAAKVTYLSSQAEFTPPVIFSVESRQKLVFMVEAQSEELSKKLHPGTPISVRLKK